ncbi:MAG: LD-carboxypeptidase [Bacteroidales bacterium]|nr:LD-carboxypeptidase [Bacteroidales bacterium]
MIRPPHLTEGSKVGIVSPAGIVSKSDIEPAIKILKDWGLKTLRGKHLYGKYNFFAGKDTERLDDLQHMLDDPGIRAIFCSRGGYGIIRLIDKLDFSRFMQHPKWIVGYSDVTILHSYLNKYLKCISLHGIMPRNFVNSRDDGSISSLKKALFGEKLCYSITNHQYNRSGAATGELAGGNLSIIYSLQGTRFDIDTDGKILFIEDVNEVIYHIDRMMMNLKLSGKLAGLKGMIVGGMTKITDTDPVYGKTAYEVIAESVADYNYPVIFGFDAGHMYPNLALLMGSHVEINVNDAGTQISFI